MSDSEDRKFVLPKPIKCIIVNNRGGGSLWSALQCAHTLRKDSICDVLVEWGFQGMKQYYALPVHKEVCFVLSTRSLEKAISIMETISAVTGFIVPDKKDHRDEVIQEQIHCIDVLDEDYPGLKSDKE